MKIALYGNVANNLYNISKALRKHTTIEPHLFLLQDRHSFTKPESDDPELEGNYPSWIHFEKRWDAAHFFKTLTIDRSFVRELNKYDAVIVSDIGGALAPYLKKSIFLDNRCGCNKDAISTSISTPVSNTCK